MGRKTWVIKTHPVHTNLIEMGIVISDNTDYKAGIIKQGRKKKTYLDFIRLKSTENKYSNLQV